MPNIDTACMNTRHEQRMLKWHEWCHELSEWSLWACFHHHSIHLPVTVIGHHYHHYNDGDELNRNAKQAFKTFRRHVRVSRGMSPKDQPFSFIIGFINVWSVQPACTHSQKCRHATQTTRKVIQEKWKTRHAQPVIIPLFNQEFIIIYYNLFILFIIGLYKAINKMCQEVRNKDEGET